MYRAKRLKDFAIPANLGEYSDVLAERDELGKTKDDPPQPFFQRYIERRTRTSKGEEQWSAVIFISPTLKQLLSSSSTIHIDASSKAVPKELGQRLLTIHVLYMEHVSLFVFTAFLKLLIFLLFELNLPRYLFLKQLILITHMHCTFPSHRLHIFITKLPHNYPPFTLNFKQIRVLILALAHVVGVISCIF